MPNSPKTPTRTIRVSDDLWQAVQAQAKLDGITVTSVIIKALYDYVSGTYNSAEDDDYVDGYYDAEIDSLTDPKYF